ncbi:MAG: tetratricopeptide repeat protein [bacterium]|nr:tetratricopeptide repeat protein [bacterium]
MNEYDYLKKAYEKMGDEKYTEVISLCGKALKINKNLSDAYNFRGNAKYELGEYAAAIEDFSKAIELCPHSSRHYYDRSWAYLRTDRSEEAILDMNKALELEPNTPGYYYDKGRMEYDCKRYKEAVSDFSKGLEISPDDVSFIRRGNCYVEMKEYDLALADYNKAISLEPDNYLAYYQRGLLYEETECLKKALNDFEKALELCPEDDDVMIELGFLQINLGKKDALKYFDRAIKVNPSKINYICRITARKKFYQRKEAIQNLAENKMIDMSEGEIIFNKKHARDDIKDLNKILELDSSDTTALRKRAARYHYLQNFSKAIRDTNTLIKLEPECSENYYVLAILNYCMEENKEALRLCNLCLEFKLHNNELTDVLFLKAQTEYELGKYKDVVSDLNRALYLEDTCGLYYYRGLANYKLWNIKQSFRDIKKALELRADSEDAFGIKIPKLIKLFLRK